MAQTKKRNTGGNNSSNNDNDKAASAEVPKVDVEAPSEKAGNPPVKEEVKVELTKLEVLLEELKDSSISSAVNVIVRLKSNPTIANKYALFNEINAIVNNADYAVFKDKLDKLNRLFVADDDETGCLTELEQGREDMKWTYGNESKIRHNLYISILNRLAARGTRSARLKNINMSPLLGRISLNGKNNLTKYYGI